MVIELQIAVASAAALLAALVLAYYQRWRRLTERERFVLAMKEAATPTLLRTEERARLRLLRAPWWRAWSWMPAAWRQGVK